MKLNSQARTSKGKNAAGRIRREGVIPANLIFGGKSYPISVNELEFYKLLQSGLRQSTVIDLDVQGADADVASNRVIVKEIQREPVSGNVTHIDFYRVTSGKKVLVKVSVELKGTSKGVKAGGALEHYIRSLKVRATPDSLMDVLALDINDLDVGEALYLENLPIPEDWDVVMQGNPIVCKVAQSRLTQTASGEGAS